ncbi:hypothetical protein F5148DRAFT_431208 [Russula earlei]|uniref:Uncharacterized protein n=1 Tax=Russula earlei TaxID=71964 RepID=A0ACC0TYY4_9AGAM|nr:hypothetical protein F5148DRAFT_431208 [Russula earlei]
MGSPSTIAPPPLFFIARGYLWWTNLIKSAPLVTSTKHRPPEGPPTPRASSSRRSASKQPNTTIRKCARVQLIKNGKKVTAFLPFYVFVTFSHPANPYTRNPDGTQRVFSRVSDFHAEPCAAFSPLACSCSYRAHPLVRHSPCLLSPPSMAKTSTPRPEDINATTTQAWLAAHLHPNADHVPPLHVVAPEPAFRAVLRIRVREDLLLRVRDYGIVDPQVSSLGALGAKAARW